jgi:alcohol dehydrogenase (cytochrome c)
MRPVKYISCCLPALFLFNVVWMASGQSLTQADIQNPKTDSWPTFNGDYSGRRYSQLKQINSGNVQDLTLAWISRINMGSLATFTGGPGAAPAGNAAANTRGTPLLVNGILYLTEPNNVSRVSA